MRKSRALPSTAARRRRRTARRRGRTPRARGGRDPREALSLINTISTAAANRAERGPGAASGRTSDRDNVSDKVDLILEGPIENILPAHAKLAKSTEDMLLKHEKMLEVELRRTDDLQARNRLMRSISDARAAVSATRERFADERAKLTAALESMRAEPDKAGRAEDRPPLAENKRVSSIFRNSVKAATAVFGVAAVSYAAYHNSARLKGAFENLAKPGAWSAATRADAAMVKTYETRERNMPEYA